MTRVLEYLDVVADGEQGSVYRCRRCEHVLGAAEGSFKLHAGSYDTPVSEGQPARMASSTSVGWILRHFICPKCGVLLEVDMLPPGAASTDSAIVS